MAISSRIRCKSSFSTSSCVDPSSFFFFFLYVSSLDAARKRCHSKSDCSGLQELNPCPFSVEGGSGLQELNPSGGDTCGRRVFVGLRNLRRPVQPGPVSLLCLGLRSLGESFVLLLVFGLLLLCSSSRSPPRSSAWALSLLGLGPVALGARSAPLRRSPSAQLTAWCSGDGRAHPADGWRLSCCPVVKHLCQWRRYPVAQVVPQERLFKEVIGHRS